MGSVKDLEVIKPPTQDEMGIGRFHFSDRYSVFDWGEMPDHIKGKGTSLCIMGAYFLEELERKGVRTHYRGLVREDGHLVNTRDLKEPTNIMEIDLVNVIYPKVLQDHDRIRYDYSVYSPTLTNFLIPLEVIYRNSIHPDSNIFKGLRDEVIDPYDFGLYYHLVDLIKLKGHLLDISTKLEEIDRYLSTKEAKRMVCLNDLEFKGIEERMEIINKMITSIVERAGLKNEDGKVEFAFTPKRELIVVDVIGTLDECRFTYKGLHVSKEVARQYYKKTRWYRDLLIAKDDAKEKGIIDWKSICKSSPPRLDPRLLEIISNMYEAAANECTALHLFNAPSLSYVMDEYKDYLNMEED